MRLLLCAGLLDELRLYMHPVVLGSGARLFENTEELRRRDEHGDPRPAGIARLARDGGSAEVALSVADELRGRGVGTALLDALSADARAAGITSFVATVCGDNPSMLSLLRHLSSSLEVRWQRGEREIVVPLGA